MRGPVPDELEGARQMAAQRDAAGTAITGGADTIVALATARGRGAIAIVRLSGPAAHAMAGRIVTPWPAVERTIQLGAVRHPATGALIDRAIITVYGAGRSYTGEPMVEIATHGGQLIPALVMEALIATGAREALPGEFTRRAVLNGKLDLLQAEAVGDLIDAQSRLMHRTAVSQLDGGLSRRVERLRAALIEIEALIAYDIDFPEEDDGPIEGERIPTACDTVLSQIADLLATAPSGELVREGAIVVLAGAPNAGKSSLYNALLGDARALVTEVPGTTRDALEAVIDAEGWPLRLVDTAGLRDSGDAVERLGIAMSERYLGRAQVVLVCGESNEALADAVGRVQAVSAAPLVAVRTKADLVTKRDQLPGSPLFSLRNQTGLTSHTRIDDHLVSANDQSFRGLRDAACLDSLSDYSLPTPRGDSPHHLVSRSVDVSHSTDTNLESKCDELSEAAPVSLPTVAVSAMTGDGLATLRAAVVEVLRGTRGIPSADLPLLTRARHVHALTAARSELRAFRDAWTARALPAPVAAVHLREAVVALESLIGVVDVEDVLDRVFGAFCIGK